MGPVRVWEYGLLTIGLANLGCSFTAPHARPFETSETGCGFEEAIIDHMDAMAKQVLWPGFAPDEIPTAVFDGVCTVLVDHPRPPDEFRPVRSRVRWMKGRHKAIRANTSADVQGVRTAVAIFDPARDGARRFASLLMHEKFHVYQDQAHPDWGANEMAMLSYPVESASVGKAALQEVDALKRALKAEGLAKKACWAMRALEQRHARFEVLDVDARQYERQTELHEGLAHYVESRAQKTPPEAPDPYRPEDVRRRGYFTGASMGSLLDVFSPGWPEKLNETPGMHLDGLLSASIKNQAGASCAWSPDEQAEFERTVRAEHDGWATRIDALRNQIFQAGGWRVRLESEHADTVLWPQGFDPLNMQRISDREVVHRRWLKVGNDTVEVEVEGALSLTAGWGDHPLAQGIRSLVVRLKAAPTIQEDGPTIVIRGSGLQAKVTGAMLSQTERELRIRLQPKG